jgi:hypothetical protein
VEAGAKRSAPLAQAFLLTLIRIPPKLHYTLKWRIDDISLQLIFRARDNLNAGFHV